MLLTLYLILSVGAALAAGITGAAWYTVLLTAVGAFFGLLVLHLLLMCVLALFVDKENPPERAFGFFLWFVTESVSLLLKLGRVRVRLEGAEKLPEGGCLLVQNHLSDFDPISLYPALKGRRLRFVSKQENLAIPVGGRLMAGAGVIGLDRENNRQGVLVMRKAAAYIKAGDTVCVYPEGTRSKTGALGPFRDGCFKAALWAGAPIAVVTVKGSEDVKKNIFRRRTDVRFRVVRVFSYDEIAGKKTDEISALVRTQILAGCR